MTERRPRHYAEQIIDLPRDKRRAALEEVPEHLREWVEGLITTHFDLKRCRKLHESKRRKRD